MCEPSLPHPITIIQNTAAKPTLPKLCCLSTYPLTFESILPRGGKSSLYI